MYSFRPWLKEMLLYLALALAFIAPRLFTLDQCVTADENLWLRRSANFYYALGQRDFKHTFQMPHPGVITSWAGTAGFLAVYPVCLFIYCICINCLLVNKSKRNISGILSSYCIYSTNTNFEANYLFEYVQNVF